MIIDEGRRLRMVESLHRLLGDEVADTLMTYLPPGGWSEVATKGDVAELRGDLRGEIGELRGELRGEIAGVRGEIAEVRGEIAELRGDLRSEIGDLRATMIRENRSMLFGLIGVFTAYGAVLVAAVRVH